MKNDTYFAAVNECTIPGMSGTRVYHSGITQYAEIAARFHASLLSRDGGFSDMNAPTLAHTAFDHADAFFAELSSRKSEESQRQAMAWRAANPHLFKDNP